MINKSFFYTTCLGGLLVCGVVQAQEQEDTLPLAPPCCKASVRINPLDLVFRRLSLEGELALSRVISVGITPSYLFGTGNSSLPGVRASGLGASGQIGFWLERVPLRGWYAKGLVGYEYVSLKSNADSLSYGEPFFGAMLGQQIVLGEESGFTISAGVGIGYFPTSKDRAVQTGPEDGREYSCGNKISQVPIACVSGEKLRLLGQFAVGYSF